MRLAALMLVGPHERERHLERCITSARQWADPLIVYCDAADHATAKLAYQYADVYRNGKENLYEQAEHLARNQLLEMADEHLDAGDIIAVADADEEFAQGPEEVRQVLTRLGDDPHESWNVQFYHLWNPEGTMHRVDGLWQPSIGPRMYRHRHGYRLEPIYGSMWVCPPMPAHLLNTAGRPPELEVLHWSYARPHDRAPKYKRYTEKLGHNQAHIESILTQPTLAPVPCRRS